MSKSMDKDVSDRGENQNSNGNKSNHQKSDATQHNKPKDAENVRDKKSSESKTTSIHAKKNSHDALPASPIVLMDGSTS